MYMCIKFLQYKKLCEICRIHCLIKDNGHSHDDGITVAPESRPLKDMNTLYDHI